MKATDLMLGEAAEKFAHNYDMGTCDGYAQECFKAGAEWMAEQTEKYYALTKEDVRRIFDLVRELQTKYSATDGCLQEVADIFNKEREKEIDL